MKKKRQDTPPTRYAMRTSSSSHCMQLSPFASSIEISAAASPLFSVNPSARCVFSSRSSTPDTSSCTAIVPMNQETRGMLHVSVVDEDSALLLPISPRR